MFLSYRHDVRATSCRRCGSRSRWWLEAVHEAGPRFGQMLPAGRVVRPSSPLASTASGAPHARDLAAGEGSRSGLSGSSCWESVGRADTALMLVSLLGLENVTGSC